jgi:hypothetical protein
MLKKPSTEVSAGLFMLFLVIVLLVCWGKVFQVRPTVAEAPAAVVAQAKVMPKKGDIVFVYENDNYAREVAGIIINPTTGERSYCLMNTATELQVVGTKENLTLLVLRSNQIEVYDKPWCAKGQEIVLHVNTVSRFQELRAWELQREAAAKEQSEKDLAILRAIKAESMAH